MLTRKFYTLGHILIAVGALVLLSIVPISYLVIFGTLSADPWGDVVLLNVFVGPLVAFGGMVLAGEL